MVPGTFDLSLVEDLSEHPITVLAELIDTSLVAVEHHAEVRYRLAHPVRAVGLHHVAPDELTRTRAAVADWAIRRIGQCRDQQDERLAGPTTALRRDTAILDAALDWLIDSGRHTDAARLAVDISLIVTDEPSADWLQRLRVLAETADPTIAEQESGALFALAAASSAWITGDVRDCTALLTHARAGLTDANDRGWLVEFIASLAMVYEDRPEAGRTPRGRPPREPSRARLHSCHGACVRQRSPTRTAGTASELSRSWISIPTCWTGSARSTGSSTSPGPRSVQPATPSRPSRCSRASASAV